MRRKKWLFLSLAVLGVLALSMAVFSSGDGSGQAASKEKMPLFLKQLSDLYRSTGVQQLSRIPSDRKMLVPQEIADLVWGDGLPVRKGAMAKAKNPLDLLVDPAIQKMWGNPDFDVARGTLITSSGPKALESPYLKVRRAWQWKGAWHAFCEFALFKAEEIANQASVIRLNLRPTPQLDNDLGSASTGAPRLRVGTPGNWETGKGFTGAGVIVGDVDTGIDWTHGDFLNPDGTTRILYLWDTSVTTDGKTPYDLFSMDGPGPYGDGFDFGTVYTKEEIDLGSCPEYDDNGHGTHTIGTAAGNGGATGKYTGMAPNADIIFVKGLFMEGIEFIFEMAHRLGRPAVVNNSYGYSWRTYIRNYYAYLNYFPGDGTCEESQYIDYLTSVYPQGAIVVKSAGNNGMYQTYRDHLDLFDYRYDLYKGSLHFGWTATSATTKAATYARQNYAPGHADLPGIVAETSVFWVRSDKPVVVTVVTGVKTYTFQTGTSGNFNDAYSTGTSFNMNLGDYYNGEYCGYIRFRENSSSTPGWGPGNWKIRVNPLNMGDRVKFDVWLDSQLGHRYSPTLAYYDWNSCFTTNAKHDEYQLDWAASANIITVGAWTTRKQYDAADGYTYYPWGFMEPTLNSITYFSSPGPSRDGRCKPDIAAPGAVIMSAASKDAGWGNYDLDPDMAHGWMWGTSMAAPHTTGGIALMLEKYPHLAIDTVRFYLQDWATRDVWTRAIGVNGFGGGKLNLKKLKTPPVAVLTVDKKVLDLSNHDVATFDGSGSYDPDKLPFKLKWTIVSKPVGAVCTLTPDDGDKAVLVPDPRFPGNYTVGLVAEGDIYSSPRVVVTVQAVQ